MSIGKLPNVAPVVSIRTRVAIAEMQTNTGGKPSNIVRVTRVTMAPRLLLVGRLTRLVLNLVIPIPAIRVRTAIDTNTTTSRIFSTIRAVVVPVSPGPWKVGILPETVLILASVA